MIGLIFGDTDFPNEILKTIKKKKIDYLIIDLSKSKKFKKNIMENISNLNGSFKENTLVKEVIEFITKDKKRSICTPFS